MAGLSDQGQLVSSGQVERAPWFSLRSAHEMGDAAGYLGLRLWAVRRPDVRAEGAKLAHLAQHGQAGQFRGVDAVCGPEPIPFGFLGAGPVSDAGGNDVLFSWSVADGIPIGQHSLFAGVDEVFGIGVAVDHAAAKRPGRIGVLMLEFLVTREKP